MMRSVADKTDDRQPIDFNKAIWHLVEMFHNCHISPETYSACHSLIARIYWISEKQLAALVEQARRENGEQIAKIKGVSLSSEPSCPSLPRKPNRYKEGFFL
jgi:hypothetical protein